MAKKPMPTKQPAGPFLTAALFCDQVLHESNSTLSAIRIIDIVTITVPHDAPENVPSEEARIHVPVTGLVSFKAGEARGTHKMRMVMVSPTGKEADGPTADVFFGDQPDAGFNINVNLAINASKGGQYWFKVFLNDHFYTQIPLRLDFPRAKPPEPPTVVAPPAAKTSGKRSRRGL